MACAWSRNNKDWSVPGGQAFFKKRSVSREELRQLEIESFGFPVNEHPLEKYLPAQRQNVQKAKDIPAYKGRVIRLAGVYITRKMAVTKNKEPMTFVTFEDETDIYECVLFPRVFTGFSDLLNWEKLFMVTGRVEESFGIFTINLQRLESLSGGLD